MVFSSSILLLGQVLAQVKGNGDDDDKALCNVGVSGVDAEELQANLQDFKDQNADQNAGDLADAAVGGNAADGAGCDSFQLIAVAGVGGSAAGLCADEEAAEEYGLVILKSVMENGEELLSTLDSDEELDKVYDLFMEQILSDEDE